MGDKIYNIKVKGYAVTITTDRKKFDSLDQLVLSLLFEYYRKQNPDRLKALIQTINTQFDSLPELKLKKKKVVTEDT